MNIFPIKLSVTTCYLIKAEDEYILIDTGYEEDLEIFHQQINMIGISVNQISHIILTHHHDDHCGLIHPILKENPSIQIVMSHLCCNLITKGENDQTHGGGLINKRIAFLMRYKQFYISLKTRKKVSQEKNLKFTPYYKRECDIITNGETNLRDIGIPLDGKIIETPGHTIDSITILLDTGDAFVGDAAADMLSFAGTKNCVIFICNLDNYYKSWQKLINLGAKAIYPAHGKPFLVDKLIKNMGRNKEKNIMKYITK